MKLEGALCFGVSMSFTPFVRSPRYIRVLLNIGRNRESEKSESESNQRYECLNGIHRV